MTDKRIPDKISYRKWKNRGGFSTYRASQEALAKNWLSTEEDKSWAHLQKEK